MLRSVLVACVLIAVLHLLAPVLEPRTLAVEELSGHLGETVALEGWVVDTRNSGRYQRVTLQDATGAATILMETDPPPRGAWVRVLGQAAGGTDGLVVWSKGPAEVLSDLTGKVLDVDVALARAPQLANVPITVVGAWAADGRALVARGHRLTVVLDDAPAAGTTVAVRGTIRYAADTAAYHLEGLAWHPWNSRTVSPSP